MHFLSSGIWKSNAKLTRPSSSKKTLNVAEVSSFVAKSEL
jgi:hypothetical protein